MPASLKLGSRALRTEFWDDNPIFRQVLGICSALAVTNRMVNTLLMCGGLIWATALSSVTVSLLRQYIPKRVRMIVQVLIIAVYVIAVDIAMKAWFPDIHRQIAAYVGLIITNCIIMGRLEAYASKNPVHLAFFDGLGAGLGYSVILLVVAAVREVLGFGTLFGISVQASALPGWQDWTIMVMPPGAFFVLALWVWIARGYDARRQARTGGKEAAKQ